MTNIVRPFAPQAGEMAGWTALIEGLYAQSDSAATEMSLKAKVQKPLSRQEDISLVADVIEALKDPEQARFARLALRHALKEVAKAALSRSGPASLRR